MSDAQVSKKRSATPSEPKNDAKKAKLMFWPEPIYLSTSENLSESKTFRFFVDGACSGNQQKDIAKRAAGFGIWLETNSDVDHKWTVAKPLQAPCTNNRAELMAIVHLLQTVIEGKEFNWMKANDSIVICGDNDYALNVCTKWLAGWRQNGFIAATGKPVENQDIVRLLDNLLQQSIAKKIHLGFQWVRAHQNEPSNRSGQLWKFWHGNKIADQLAVQGSQIK